MTFEKPLVSSRAADLRQEFDESFSFPAKGSNEGHQSLIALRVAGEALAVRTPDVTGIAKRKGITPLPGQVPGLLGLTVVRGSLLPVYDLAVLLGLPGAGGSGPWVMFTNRETPLAFVFDDFEGQIEIKQASLDDSESPLSHKHLRSTALIGATHRAVIDVPGIVEEIRTRAGVEPAEGIAK